MDMFESLIEDCTTAELAQGLLDLENELEKLGAKASELQIKMNSANKAVWDVQDRMIIVKRKLARSLKESK